MNCYFTCQKLSNFSKTCFTTTKETALAPFNLAHPVHLDVCKTTVFIEKWRYELLVLCACFRRTTGTSWLLDLVLQSATRRQCWLSVTEGRCWCKTSSSWMKCRTLTMNAFLNELFTLRDLVVSSCMHNLTFNCDSEVSITGEFDDIH